MWSDEALFCWDDYPYEHGCICGWCDLREEEERFKRWVEGQGINLMPWQMSAAMGVLYEMPEPLPVGRRSGHKFLRELMDRWEAQK